MNDNFLDSYAPKLAHIVDDDFVIQIGDIKFYQCNCGKNDIKQHYSYCPFCGSKLIFKLKKEDKIDDNKAYVLQDVPAQF